MRDTTIVNGIRRKYNTLVDDLDERGGRRWAATEAESIGYGGIAVLRKQLDESCPRIITQFVAYTTAAILLGRDAG